MGSSGGPPAAGSEEEKIYELITELLDPATRETALLELSKKREMYEDLALVLWGGFGRSPLLNHWRPCSDPC
jgi:CCR4-NOT transcription complex subunit 9